jgi:hypothetical protein
MLRRRVSALGDDVIGCHVFFSLNGLAGGLLAYGGRQAIPLFPQWNAPQALCTAGPPSKTEAAEAPEAAEAAEAEAPEAAEAAEAAEAEAPEAAEAEARVRPGRLPRPRA